MITDQTYAEALAAMLILLFVVWLFTRTPGPPKPPSAPSAYARAARLQCYFEELSCPLCACHAEKLTEEGTPFNIEDGHIIVPSEPGWAAPTEALKGLAAMEARNEGLKRLDAYYNAPASLITEGNTSDCGPAH